MTIAPAVTQKLCATKLFRSVLCCGSVGASAETKAYRLSVSTGRQDRSPKQTEVRAMADSTIKVLADSRKLRDEVRTRRETLKRELAHSQKVIASAIEKTISSITAAKKRK